ncbi:MAG: fused response regulator/phosphatase [Nitrosomonadales bacterium]|nr:fused response regulator/phosphatase [Nitrosomonadales bacterium]
MIDRAAYSRDAGNQPLRILVVDDTPANVALLRAALNRAGHTVIAAASGEQALELFVTDRPDVVLMDVMMPGIGGIEATRRMRALNIERWIPIIFVSALSHRDDMVRGLEAGGDDYVVKPVDLVLLLAKINAMQRIAMLERRLHQANGELLAARDASEYELNMAKELMAHMVRESSLPVPGVELWLQPAAELSGDLVITQKYCNDRDYVLLADAMGHGLPAALPLMPLVQVFSTMTSDGFTVSAIVREMNARLKSLLPVGNFVAVTLLSVDRANRVLEIWNGGNPAALLLDAEGSLMRQFKSSHPAIGVLRGDDFDGSTELFQWSQQGWLMCYSDGLSDVRNAQGEEFGTERIMEASLGGDPVQALTQAVTAHLKGCAAHDDISLAVIDLQQT